MNKQKQGLLSNVDPATTIIPFICIFILCVFFIVNPVGSTDALSAIRSFLEKTMFEEIIPTLDLPRDEVEGFAASVIDRFDNPYIDHQLLDIALNSASKWKARVMPSLTEYVRRMGRLPKRLSFSLAAFIAFYHKGERDGAAYPVRDDPWVLDFFAAHKDDDNAALAKAVVSDERLWDGELAKIEGLEAAVAAALDRIDEAGMYEAMKECAE